MNEGTIALIGAGNGGLALLKVLLDIPGVQIKYVCDINTEAVGFVFAKKHNIKCINDYEEIISDKKINLIFEATGNPKIFKDLSNKKSLRVSLIGGDGSKIIYNLLDAYNEINQNLEEYKDNLELKIIERTEDLEKANANLGKEMLEYEKISQKLQEINVEKSKYLLYATHQLKAPFAAIQSYVDIILEGYSGNISQRTKDIVLKIKERCELLSNVIKEMLELSKLKSRNSGEISFKKLDINLVLLKVVERFQVIATTKNIIITFEKPKEIYYIRGSESQVDVLFAILIDNAINYSPANTIITVTLKKMESSQIYIGVKDQGIGIPEKNIRKIFNEFFRSNNAVDFHNNGTGLGLSIAKEIASIHNATIQVESKLNEGSCFSVIFHLI
ncbi:MAG: sensor histidine kinase [Candidatus Humimicrobiaceae bacterium]